MTWLLSGLGWMVSCCGDHALAVELGQGRLGGQGVLIGPCKWVDSGRVGILIVIMCSPSCFEENALFGIGISPKLRVLDTAWSCIRLAALGHEPLVIICGV